MIPTDVIDKWLAFAGATAVLSGAMAAWWRKGSDQEDAVYAQAADVILAAEIDADLRNRIKLHTGRDIGEQLTVEQAMELERERELRRFERRN